MSSMENEKTARDKRAILKKTFLLHTLFEHIHLRRRIRHRQPSENKIRG